MEKPNWITGNEKRFAEYVGSLDDKDVIAVVSHKSDLDGIVSAKIVSEAIDPNIVRLVGYEELNDELIEELRKEGVTKVVMTDLNFKTKDKFIKLESFAKILIIDHHQIIEDFNSEKTVYMNAQGMCAAYLCYFLFSQIQELKSWDWAVACASLSDWAWKSNGGFLSEVYKKYGGEFVPGDEEVKDSKIWDFQYKLYLALVYYKDTIYDFYDRFPRQFGELGILGGHIAEVQEEVDKALESFDSEKKEINGRYVWEFKGIFPIREVVINDRSHKIPDKTIVIYRKSNNLVKCSFRRQDRGEDVSILARKIVEGFENSDGGGHKAASGCLFPLKYIAEFMDRLKRI
ncbi:MAG: hypothetical protein FJY98_01690 [Candidatus Liptonbacteria bacterium]|nr:hypothetical protein [Candidatus Pacearchaeota archaeon]MBM3257021.1 hypothetical protein [Candidatus Liptonbacteria bacterium]